MWVPLTSHSHTPFQMSFDEINHHCFCPSISHFLTVQDPGFIRTSVSLKTYFHSLSNIINNKISSNSENLSIKGEKKENNFLIE